MEDFVGIDLFSKKLDPVLRDITDVPVSTIHGRSHSRIVADARSIYIWALIIFGGFPQRKIAKYMGISTQSIHYHMNKINILKKASPFCDMIKKVRTRIEEMNYGI